MGYKKVDANQKEIVQVLREAGAHVQSLASIGKGCPDLLISFCGEWRVAEVKTEKGKLTKDESDWIFSCRAPVSILRHKLDAIALLRGMK